MQLDGRRQSTNVDDRRGMSGGKIAGGVGLGGLIVIGLITLLLGGDPADVLEQVGGMAGTEIVSGSGRTPTAEEEELAVFSKQILAGTEDVWTEIFAQNGRNYIPRSWFFTMITCRPPAAPHPPRWVRSTTAGTRRSISISRSSPR
jgi:predicted metalloprotease